MKEDDHNNEQMNASHKCTDERMYHIHKRMEECIESTCRETDEIMHHINVLRCNQGSCIEDSYTVHQVDKESQPSPMG